MMFFGVFSMTLSIIGLDTDWTQNNYIYGVFNHCFQWGGGGGGGALVWLYWLLTLIPLSYERKGPQILQSQ